MRAAGRPVTLRNRLSRLDHLFIRLAVASHAFAHGRAWRAGRAIESATRFGHETSRRLARRLGMTDLPRWLVRTAQEHALPDAPRYPSFFATGSREAGLTHALLRGQYVLVDGREGPLASISWLRDPFGDHSSLDRLRFHSLEWVSELVQAWRTSLDLAYLVRAQELTARWIGECLDRERSDNLWSDHATALRALVLCDLWHACRSEEPVASPFMQSLLEALARHGDKLANERLYRREHNHGVTQAYALLAIGLLFPALPGASGWAALGQARLEAQMAENVSPEGLHREHSPYYHFYVFRQLSYAHRLARAYGVAFSPEFTLRLEAMLVAGAHLVKPTGGLPALGDSSVASPVLVDPEDLDDQPGAARSFSWSISGGRTGGPPPAASALFPGAGLALLRSGWGEREPFTGERFLAVRLSTFETSHVHRDLFSFEFAAYGAELVVDSGGPFAYRHPLRAQYFVRTRAHNTVIVDDADQAIAESVVRCWHESPEGDALVAEHRAYPGVLHRRLLALVRPDMVLVVDRLESDTPRRYAQLFHLSPDLRVALDGAIASTSRTAGDGSPGVTLRIVPLLDADLTPELSQGVSSPPQGWVATGEGQRVAGPVVEYRRHGRTVTFAALLLPERPDAIADLAWTLEGVPLDGPARVAIRRGGDRAVVAIEASGEVHVMRSP